MRSRNSLASGPSSRVSLRLAVIVPLVTCVALAGCGGKSEQILTDDIVLRVSAGKKLKLESEQVSLKIEYVNCGVENELFDPPVQLQQRMVARLTDAARDLGFSDDVSINDAGYTMPYAQVRGTFPVELRKVVSIKDSEEGGKKVEAWAGVRINHPCFSAPLPIMGVKRGTINQSLPAAFEFAWAMDGWHLDHILHQ
jgi:hypothetical protein